MRDAASSDVSKHGHKSGPGKVPLRLNVNGEIYEVTAEPRRTLLDVLRNDLRLTGAKKRATEASVERVRCCWAASQCTSV